MEKEKLEQLKALLELALAELSGAQPITESHHISFPNGKGCVPELNLEKLPELRLYLKDVKQSTQELWIREYGLEYVIGELAKAVLWISANTAKAPKSQFGRFFNNWLTNSWERNRKALPGSNIAQKTTLLKNLGIKD